MRRARRSILLKGTIAAWVLTLAVSASAAPTAADRETARALMEKGRELRGKGDLKGSLTRFQAANDIMHVPTTALEVARTQVALGLLVEARDTVATLRQTAANNESQVFKTARASAEELDTSLAGRVPSVTIAVKGVPAAQTAEVSLDGIRVPDAVLGLPRSVDPGHHVLTAKAGAGEGRQEFDIREGEQKPVELTVVGAAAVEAGPLSDASTEPTAPPPRSHFPTTLTYVGIGVAGVGLIVGSVTGIVAISKKSSLTGQCANGICGPSSYGTLDSASTMATVSDVGFAVFGAGAALTVVSIFVGRGGSAPAAAPASTGSRLHVEPWLAGSVGGLRGTF